MTVTVACVLKSSGNELDDRLNGFIPEYVEVLRDSFARHATLPFRFVVLTDSPAAKFTSRIEVVKLKFGLKGWWSKMELFSPENRANLGPTLYLDLDTAITDSVDDLLRYCSPAEPRGDEAPFTILRDFYRPNGYGSGAMFIPSDFTLPWTKFMEGKGIGTYRQHMDDNEGDQNFLEEAVPGAALWQDVMPRTFYSYKPVPAFQLEELPKRVSVLCFHGFPRPWMLPKDHWTRDHWRRDDPLRGERVVVSDDFLEDA